MEKNYLVNINYVYLIVLLLVLSAWFGHSTTKETTINKKNVQKNAQVVSKSVNNKLAVGLDSNNLSHGTKCNIELINGLHIANKIYSINKSDVLNLVGWAIDVERERIPEQVIVRFSNEKNSYYYTASQTGLIRNDVRESFNLPYNVRGSGFKLTTNIHDIAVGQYFMSLLLNIDDITYVCDNGRKLRIR